MGIATARIGQTLPQGLLPNESQYYADQKQLTIFPDVTPHHVPVQYGAWYQEGFDGDGGWVISAIDYAKFVDAIAGIGGNAFLKPETIAEMTARPNLPEYIDRTHWYAFGLAVEPTANGQNWWNDGANDGTFTKWYKRDDGLVMVAFFNSRSNPPSREGALQNAVDNGLVTSANSVSYWPTTDYISEFTNVDPVQAASAPALNTAEGVRNAATMQHGVVPGSWATLLGINLGKGWPKWPKFDNNGGVLPVSIGGVSVNINGKPAYLASVSPTVIQAQVPSDIAPGWVPVEVINNGVHTTKILTWITQYAPGAFTYKQEGTVFAVVTGSAGWPIDGRNPAQPGEAITLYATGLVPTAAGVWPVPHEQIDGISLQIGGQAAAVRSATLTSPGIFLIDAVVPTVPLGNQSLVITSHSVNSPANVIIPIGTRSNFVY